MKELMAVDISYNHLENFHIDTIFRSAPKLKSFYMEHNLVNIIPSSIANLKHLVDFRHDWNIFLSTNH